MEPLRVVIIEDEIDLLETYEDGLIMAGGFEVLCASDAVKAMSLISRKHPDIVVVDLNLPNTPRGTIIPFVRGLRGKNHKMEILIVSGAENIDEIAETWSVPHYLRKPITAQELAEKLRELDPRKSV